MNVCLLICNLLHKARRPPACRALRGSPLPLKGALDPRSPSLVGRCPLTCEEEEEAPDWLANRPKGTGLTAGMCDGSRPSLVPRKSDRESAVVAYPPIFDDVRFFDDARFSTLQPICCRIDDDARFPDDARLQVSFPGTCSTPHRRGPLRPMAAKARLASAAGPAPARPPALASSLSF